MHPTHLPIRVATGAYILNSGLGKLKTSEEEAAKMHGWAASVYPFLGDIKAKDFAKLLAYGEIGLGAALLLPTVPSAIAGTALAAFGAGLTGLYLKTPGMTQPDGIRPTQEGMATSKDVWLVGAGLTLATQSFLSGTKQAARAVASGVTDAADSVASGVSNAAGAAVSGVSDAAGAAVSGVTGAVGLGATPKVSKKAAKKAAKKGLSGLASSTQNARADLADALADLAEAMTKR